jgi:hypothetical protein
MARLLWEAITEGKVELPNGTKIDMGPDDWFDTVQFMYKQIDGPPKQAVDVTSGGEKIAIVLSWPEEK